MKMIKSIMILALLISISFSQSTIKGKVIVVHQSTEFEGCTWIDGKSTVNTVAFVFRQDNGTIYQCITDGSEAGTRIFTLVLMSLKGSNKIEISNPQPIAMTCSGTKIDGWVRVNWVQLLDEK